MRACAGGLLSLAAAACGDSARTHDASVLELHGSPARTGSYTEPAFTHAAAANLHIDAMFDAPYDGAAFAQALYVDRGGSRDLLIAASEHNVVSAVSSSCALVWQRTLGTPH